MQRRIIVDTSVWIESFRHPASSIGLRLQEMIREDFVATCAPIQAEIIMGSSQGWKKRIDFLIRSLKTYIPEEADWLQIQNWLTHSRPQGQTFSIVDLLIASIAKREQLPLWSLDRDFERIGKIFSITLWRAPS